MNKKNALRANPRLLRETVSEKEYSCTNARHAAVNSEACVWFPLPRCGVCIFTASRLWRRLGA